MSLENIPHHLSYSSLNKLGDCLLCWFSKYVLQVPERRSGPQFLGITLHHSLDALNRGLIPATPDALVEHFDVSWRTQAAWDPCNWSDIDWGRKDPQKAQFQAQQFHEHGWRLARLYVEEGHHARNRPMPSGVGPLTEFQLTIPLGPYGGRHFTELIARLDLVTEDGRLLDYKTKNAFTQIKQDKVPYDLQPKIYAWGLDEAGILPAPITFRYAQLIYGGKDYAYDESVGGVVKPWQVDRMRQLVIPGLVEQAESAVEMLQNSSDPLQTASRHLKPGKGCDWCSYKGQCPFYVEGKAA